MLSVCPVNSCGKAYVSNIQIKVSDILPKISEHITGDNVCCYNSTLYYAIYEDVADMTYFWETSPPQTEFNQNSNILLTDWTNSGEYLLYRQFFFALWNKHLSCSCKK